jgi:hypothetical protein
VCRGMCRLLPYRPVAGVSGWVPILRPDLGGGSVGGREDGRIIIFFGIASN